MREEDLRERNIFVYDEANIRERICRSQCTRAYMTKLMYESVTGGAREEGGRSRDLRGRLFLFARWRPRVPGFVSSNHHIVYSLCYSTIVIYDLIIINTFVFV